MGTPRFTFCVPNLNKCEFLPACIESILAQTSSEWQCVFVDGYSTDGSWEYMQKFASDPRFLLLRGRKLGMYDDWNECLQYVDTEYFYFLTSDDVCYSQLVQRTISMLDMYSTIDVCHFQCNLIDQNGKILGKTDDLFGADFIYSDINQYTHCRSGLCDFFMHFVYRALYTSITALVFRKSLIEKLKHFRTDFGTFGDFDWTMRMCLFTDIVYIKETLSTWRSYEHQATRLVSSFQYHDWSQDIAISNFKLFFLINNEHSLDKKINKYKKVFLTKFHDEYIAAFLRASLASENIFVFWFRLHSVLLNDPFYLLRRINAHINRRLHLNKEWRSELAFRVISDLGLKWPPERLIPSKML
jgi:glycosyltransferase involved in cell wall biosynthesis